MNCFVCALTSPEYNTKLASGGQVYCYYSQVYSNYIEFGLGGFYGISTIVGYLMSNPFYTHISNIYDLAWLGLVGFHDILTIVGHLIPNPLYTYISNIYDLVLWHCRGFNANSFLYIYMKYIWFGLVGFNLTVFVTTLSYWNCVITLVGSWWGQGIAHAFTHCMIKIWFG